MDYHKEYAKLNPTYHEEDAPRKIQDVINSYSGHPKSILDLGCGSGQLSELIYNSYNPSKYTAIDISQTAIDIAKDNGSKKINWIVGDVFDFKIKEKYDLVYIGDLVEHVDSDINFLNKVKVYGKNILIRIPLERVAINDILRILKITDEYKRFEHQFGHVHHYSVYDFEKLLKRCNLKVVNRTINPLSKRSKKYMELIRQISLIFWKISPSRVANLFGGFAMYLVENEN